MAVSRSMSGLSDHKVLTIPPPSSPALLPPLTPSRSSNNSPASCASSRSSLYLSPSWADSDPEIPPYKPGDDDLVSLNMRTKRRDTSKVNHRKTKRKPGAIEQVHHIDRQPNMSRPLQEDEGATSPIASGDMDTGRFSNKITSEISDTTSSPRPFSDQVYGWSTSNSEKTTPTQTPDNKRRWSFGKSGVLLNASRTTACAVDISNDNPSGQFASIIRDFGIPMQVSMTDSDMRNLNSRDRAHQQSRVRDSKPVTPATITLRKASKISRSKRAYGSFGLPSQHARIRPITEPKSLPCDRLYEDSSVLLSRPPAWVTDQVDAPVAFPIAPRSCILLSNFQDSTDCPLVERQTAAAESALTFAQLYTTPGTFSTSATSRKHSLLARETIRRSSAILIRSGGSVHEIIWDKDDIPSSPDSACSPTVDDSPRRLSMKYSELEESEASNFKLQNHGITQRIQALGNIGEWSWNGQQSNRILDEEADASGSQALQQGKRPSRSTTQRGRWSKSWGKNPRDAESSMESFPPLPERKSTLESRRRPLIDINDPMSGRTEEHGADSMPPEIAPEGIIEEPKSDEERRTARENKTQLDDTDWDSINSQVGKGIGSSSHHRRPSAAPCQERPLGSLLDIPQSAARRTSQIPHSLSDMALHLATDQHDSHFDMRPSRSTESLSRNINGLESFQPLPSDEPMTRVWRANSRGGLRIDSSGMLSDSRVLRVAGLEEVAEDGVDFR